MTNALAILENPDAIPKLLAVARGEFEQNASAVKRVLRGLTAAARRNPDLMECTPESIYGCVHFALSVGLDPSLPHGHIYVIPRKNKHRGGSKEAESMIGYKGWIELARQCGVWMDANCIYEGEAFHYDRGTGEITHPFDFTVNRDDDKLIGAYAVARTKQFERPVSFVLTRADIEKRKKRGVGSQPAWSTDYAAMCRKSAIRALMTSGLVPVTPAVSRAAMIERGVEEEGRPFSASVEVVDIGGDQEDYSKIPEIPTDLPQENTAG